MRSSEHNKFQPMSRRRGFRGLHGNPARLREVHGGSAWGIVVLLAGLALLFYPYASNYLNQAEQQKVINRVSQTVENAAADDVAEQWNAAQRYNERLFTGMTCVVDPFDQENAASSNEEYAGVLNVSGDGAMGEIIIPQIGVDLPIYHGTQGDSMNHAVGHVTNTSLPVGGESSHTVLAGHTGLSSAVIFDHLDKLEIGDLFVICVLGRNLAYEVYLTEVVLPDDTSSLGIQRGQDLVTLVTCTPYGVNSHRLLVHARRCDLPEDWSAYREGGRDGSGLDTASELFSLGWPPSLPVVVALAAAVAAVAVFVGRAIAKRRDDR